MQFYTMSQSYARGLALSEFLEELGQQRIDVCDYFNVRFGEQIKAGKFGEHKKGATFFHRELRDYDVSLSEAGDVDLKIQLIIHDLVGDRSIFSSCVVRKPGEESDDIVFSRVGVVSSVDEWLEPLMDFFEPQLKKDKMIFGVVEEGCVSCGVGELREVSGVLSMSDIVEFERLSEFDAEEGVAGY